MDFFRFLHFRDFLFQDLFISLILEINRLQWTQSLYVFSLFFTFAICIVSRLSVEKVEKVK